MSKKGSQYEAERSPLQLDLTPSILSTALYQEVC